MTAAGGSGTLIPEDLVSSDGNYGDRDAERNRNLVHGIGEYTVMQLGLSTERGAQRRRMPPVLGHIATIQLAPFKYGESITRLA